MFLHVSVILSTWEGEGGRGMHGRGECVEGMPPSAKHTPLPCMPPPCMPLPVMHAPPAMHALSPCMPPATHAPCHACPWSCMPPPHHAHPPATPPPPPCMPPYDMRSMSGRYASYWNTFLSIKWFLPFATKLLVI